MAGVHVSGRNTTYVWPQSDPIQTDRLPPVHVEHHSGLPSS